MLVTLGLWEISRTEEPESIQITTENPSAASVIENLSKFLGEPPCPSPKSCIYRRKNVPTRHSTGNAERHLNTLRPTRDTPRRTRRGSSRLRAQQCLRRHQPDNSDPSAHRHWLAHHHDARACTDRTSYQLR